MARLGKDGTVIYTKEDDNPVVKDKDGNILFVDEGDDRTLDVAIKVMEATDEENAKVLKEAGLIK